jgi:hypothetical protein
MNSRSPSSSRSTKKKRAEPASRRDHARAPPDPAFQTDPLPAAWTNRHPGTGGRAGPAWLEKPHVPDLRTRPDQGGARRIDAR